MSQLDRVMFSPAIIWSISCFFFLYFILTTYFLPLVYYIMRIRDFFVKEILSLIFSIYYFFIVFVFFISFGVLKNLLKNCFIVVIFLKKEKKINNNF